MGEKICAVVVTFNRLELLKKCIESLRNQTRKLDEIIIVNNSSSDGTKEWVDQQNDITVIHQENLGGAGGFHNGIKAAYEKGHDWIWCMDDDCLPHSNSLELLLSFKNERESVLNSLVLTKTDISKINFGFFDYAEKKFYDNISEINSKKHINGAGFFNGTLIPRKIVSQVGLPNPKYFIYGDEYEYYSRIISAEVPVITVTSSIVLHPEQKHKYFGKGKFFYRFNYLNKLGVKYFPRNLMAIWYNYNEFTFRRLLKTYFYDITCLLFIQKNFSFAIKYIYSILSGPSFIKETNKIKFRRN